MASIELRTPKNKPAYYKITANITLNGRTIRKFSRFEFDPKTLKTAKQRTAAATAAAFEFEAKAQEEAERSLSGASKPFREVADEYIASTKAKLEPSALLRGNYDFDKNKANTSRNKIGYLKKMVDTLTTGCQQGTVEVRPVKNPIKSDLARNTERTGKPGAPMHTLTTKDRHGVLCEGRIRRLTPRECLRLQGWADDRIDTVLAIQSDNQAYKQAGNGVTVNVVEAIGRRIAAMDAELRGEALAP